MHAFGVFEAVPSLRHGGGGIQAHAMVQSLRDSGHRVTIAFTHPDYATMDGSRAERLSEMKDLGVSVHEIAIPPQGRATFPSLVIARALRGLRRALGDYTVDMSAQTGAIAAALPNLVAAAKPDVLFGYHWAAGAAMCRLPTGIPRLLAVGDPFHLPTLLRRSFNRSFMSDEERQASDWTDRQIDTYIERSVASMVKMMRTCEISGAFAAHHAAMLAEAGATACRYFRTPVSDPRARGEGRRSLPEIFKILHIGHLKGIATLTGIELLATSVLPALDRLLPAGSFQVDIVGGFVEAVPATLQAGLNRPGLVFRGHVTPPDAEFLTSHVTLVPTPVELGMRVRVVTAFSYGCPVVAHAANAKGIPEMKHGENCLLADDGQGLAEACASLQRDPDLRERIGLEGRRTFERFFSLSTAGRSIAAALEGLAGGRSKAAAGDETAP